LYAIKSKMATDLKKLTQDEIKLHNKKGDCWIVIESKVYDVSEYISSNPDNEELLLNLSGNGNDALTGLAGKDELRDSLK